MSEFSRSHGTITLGRSRQVVKRRGLAVGNKFSDSHSSRVVGIKRSIRERLGSNADIKLDGKRQRRGGDRLGSKASNSSDDFYLGKDDLRFKIMKKTQSGGQQNVTDLRELLSRPGPSSRTSSSPQECIPEPSNGRPRMLEPRDGRERKPEPRRNNGRQRNLEPNYTSIREKIQSTRSVEAIPKMDVMRGPYSPRTSDHVRCRSPDRVLDKSRGLSPARNLEELQRRPVTRAYDDLSTTTYMSRDGHELSRPGVSFMSKPSIPAKPVGPLVFSQLAAAGALARRSYSVDDQLTIEGFLHSLGLEKYAITFKVEEVDMHALRNMGDNDLKELGIPMGPRKKIILALLARARRQMQVR